MGHSFYPAFYSMLGVDGILMTFIIEKDDSGADAGVYKQEGSTYVPIDMTSSYLREHGKKLN